MPFIGLIQAVLQSVALGGGHDETRPHPTPSHLGCCNNRLCLVSTSRCLSCRSLRGDAALLVITSRRLLCGVIRRPCAHSGTHLFYSSSSRRTDSYYQSAFEIRDTLTIKVPAGGPPCRWHRTYGMLKRNS